MNVNFENLPTLVGVLISKIENLEALLLNKQEEQSEGQIKNFLNVKEAAKFLHLKESTIYAKVHKSELPYMKQGNKLYFCTDKLTAYLEQGNVSSFAEIEQKANLYLSNNKKRV